MKLILIMVVLVVLGLTLTHYMGGVPTMVPAAEQYQKVLNEVRPGMLWTEVVEIAGAPKKYRPMIPKSIRGMDGKKTVIGVLGAANKFRSQAIADRLEAGSLDLGFQVRYAYTTRLAVIIRFDSDGLVASVAPEDRGSILGIPVTDLSP